MAKNFRRLLNPFGEDTSKDEDLLRKKGKDVEDEGEGGTEGSSGRGSRRPRGESYLGEDTAERENKRRKIEIAGLIAETGCASEPRRDRDAPPKDRPASEKGLEAPVHPIVGKSQQYDGLDSDVNPIPDLTTPEGQEAYQLQQQLKLQKRQELQQRLANKPEFKPPGM